MKTKAFLAMLLLVITTCGCSKTEEETTFPEAVMVKSFATVANTPEHSFVNFALTQDGYRVVQNKEALQVLFPNTDLSTIKEFKDIDFGTQTLIIGRKGLSEVTQAKCRFSKKNNNSYVLTVDLDLLGLFGPVVLYYGAIVQKLPENATVSVEVLPLEVNKDI
ncbi:Uncharacterised protein [Capnocytophaga ochracea]|uniref:Lipoprotein n=1 Tax=Capnocytophaga ochracea TaxID=1018 RepID=A0A7Z9CAK4_CAPOC|nr:hypothetical protein [Capnocytophaga ochracea]VDG81932.1 Uncharacterised protein [Capnocytophaga ochracea]